MADIHITDFHKDAAKILRQVYASFPQKITVFVEDIAGADTPDEFGLHSPRHLACLATMSWLADAGYIYYQDTIRQEAIDQVTLTHRGFKLLSGRLCCTSQYPEKITRATAQLNASTSAYIAGGNFTTTIELLRTSLSSGSSSAIDEIMQILLSQP